MGFWNCVVYLLAIGVSGAVLGRLLPAEWFCPERFPFRETSLERSSRIYEKLGIRRWQKLLPDLSRILPGLLPEKKLGADYRDRLPEMIRETMIAEMVHAILALMGLYCLKLWKGMGGIVMACLNAAGNVLYILIQRYNRPRLIRLMKGRSGRNLVFHGV